MVKIKLSALACAILVGGGQQLVAEDLNNTIDLGNYSYYQPVDINQETKTITGDATDASINVDNNGELISGVPIFAGADINIKNNSNAIFESEASEVYIEHPYLHIINNSTAVFKENLEIRGDSFPVIEQDNDFSGGSLSLDINSALDIKGSATFIKIDALINNGSTATIDDLLDFESKIYVVNGSELLMAH